MRKVRLEQAFSQFNDHWHPRIAGELNGQHVKVAKFKGEFEWHQHADEDEFFLVVQGCFRLDYQNAEGNPSSMTIEEGEFVIVPRGTPHRPYAENECQVLLFEPAETLNTGNVRSERTVDRPERLG